MRFDFELRANDLIIQSNDAIAQLRIIDERLTVASQVVQNYINDQVLKGKGFEQVRLMLEDYLSAINSLRLACEVAIVDFQRLIAEIGTEDLIGYEIEEGIRRAESELLTSGNAITRLERLLRNADWWQPTGSYRVLLNSWQNIDGINQSILDYWLSKEEHYHHIDRATRSLFTHTSEIVVQVSSGLGHIVSASSRLPTTFQSEGLTAWRVTTLATKDNILNDKLGLSPEQIQLARELGYAPSELITLFESFETFYDTMFFMRLLDGTSESFTQAFSINPWNLSPEMTLVMSDFSIRLFENDMERFTYFVNSVLSSDRDAFAVTQNREGYLERLFSGTYTMLGYNAFMIAAGVGSERDRLRFDNQKSLSGFWSSLAIITNELRANMWESSVLNLNMTDIQLQENGNIYFDLSYRCPVALETRNITSTNTIEIDGFQLNRNRSIEQLEQLRIAQERFSGELFVNILENSIRTIVTIAIPAMGAFYRAMDLVSNTPNSIGGYSQLTSNQAIKDGIKVGNFSLQAIHALLTWNSTDNALNKENRNNFIEWFGSGVRTRFTLPEISGRHVTAIEGLYNPNTIQRIQEWEANGLVGLGILDEEQVTTILASRDFNGFDEATQLDIKALLTGGFSIINESGFNAERFLNTISDIDMILRVDIQSEWNNLIRGNGNEIE